MPTSQMLMSSFDQIVRTERLSDKIVEQIQQMMRTGELKIGDKLPPERELVTRMGVSRTVIREAVRSLAAKGLVGVRAGDGTVVLSPSDTILSDMISMMLHNRVREDAISNGISTLTGIEVSFAHLQEVRRLLETEIAGLAALRRNDNDLALMQIELDAMIRNQENPEEWASADVAFHAAIAQATHNPLFPVLLGSISTMLIEVRMTGIRLAGTTVKAYQHHTRIFEQLKAGDATGARHAMQAHLAESEDTYRTARKIL